MQDNTYENEKRKDYWSKILPELSPEVLEHTVNVKTAADLAIPEIAPEKPKRKPKSQVLPLEGAGSEIPGSPVGDVPAPPKSPKQNPQIMQLQSEIAQLKESFIHLDLENKLRNLKNDIITEIAQELKLYRSELDDLKNKKIPKRKFFDTEGAYKENLFGMATQLLDEILPYLFGEIPDYSLIATQISSTFDDGTIENALIAINVTMNNGEYRYDFKVDVPVMNGVIQSPLYLERGLKIIPLTKDAIEKEMASMSFNKLRIDRPYEKPNTFNNIGENIHRKPDNQKFYQVETNNNQSVGVPPRSRYKAVR